MYSSNTVGLLSAAFTVLLASLPAVNAHGYPQTIDIAGKSYSGWLPFEMGDWVVPTPKVIERKMSGDGPVTDITSEALACNDLGVPGAALVADANAGDKVTWTMVRWPEDHHGPLTAYMANCDGDCKSFNPTKKNVWFKVAEEGMDSPGVFATDKMIQNNLKWSAAIPASIKPGQYLMRYEILALHSAGAPQFYPFCIQLNVKGSGSSVPTSSDLVSIPGVYANAGDAIWGNIWNQPTSWPVAGPKVVSFAGGSGNGGGSGSGGKDDGGDKGSSGGGDKGASNAGGSPPPPKDGGNGNPPPTSTGQPPATKTSSASASTATSTGKSGRCKNRRRSQIANAAPAAEARSGRMVRRRQAESPESVYARAAVKYHHKRQLRNII